jgi:hypothetical protein
MFLESSPDYQNGKAALNFIKRVGTVIFLSALACLCVGCAGISSSAGNQSTASSNSNSKISLSPATLTISSGTQRQFVATVTSTGRGLAGFVNPEIIWHASAGTITSGGLFTAPTVTSSTTVTVTATSVADEGAVAISEVTIVPASKVVISISPTAVSIAPGAKQQFSATMTSTSNTAVTWQASAGTISSSGLYTAPSATTSSKVTVTAISVADASNAATAQITLVVPVKLSISLGTVPAGTIGVPYSASLTATGGTAPYSWQVTAGSLPSGLSLGANSGLISGTPSKSGTFTFTTSVTDASSATVSQPLSIAMSSNNESPLCGPPAYICSTSSSSVVQTPNQAPFSGATGYNQIRYDTSLNPAGTDPILRASDSTMLSGHVLSSTASGGDNDEGWNCAGRTDTSTACKNATLYFLTAQYGGCPYVEAIKMVNGLPTVVAPFPAATGGSTTHPTPCGSLTWSHQNPNVAFMEGAVTDSTRVSDPVIYQITYSWDGVVGHSATFTQTVLYDIGVSSGVLPNGIAFNKGWSGPLSQDINDNIFVISLSAVNGIASGVDTISVTKGSNAFAISGPSSLPTDGSWINAYLTIAGVTNTYTITTIGSRGTLGTMSPAYSGTTNPAASLSIPGGQGTGVYEVAVQLSPAAAANYNVFTGTVMATGAWSGGTIDSGCSAMHIHDGFMFTDGQYVQISGSSTGVNCGTTSNFWQIGTTHAVGCTGTNAAGGALCGGHNAFGYHNEVGINNPHFANFDPADASSSTPLPIFGTIDGNCEDHFSWRNASAGDTQPIIGSSANPNYSSSRSTSSWTYAGQNENFALMSDGTLKRFGHNFILGPDNTAGCGTTNVGPFDTYFTAQNSIGITSQDGRLWVWNSSMLGQLGTDEDGGTRADEFVQLLQ